MGGQQLSVWGQWRQADGSSRYALAISANAKSLRAQVRADPTMVDSITAEVLVEREQSGRLVAYEWLGRSRGLSPPWAAIRAALNGAFHEAADE